MALFARNMLWPTRRCVLNEEWHRHDFVLSAPAGPYIGDLRFRREPLCLLPLALCASKDIPFGIIATSAGPFAKGVRSRLRRRILSHARFWTLRESISGEHVKELSLPVEVFQGGDLVFAHRDRPPDEFLDSYHEELYWQTENAMAERPTIAVTLNLSDYTPLNGKPSVFSHEEYVQKAARLIKHVQAKTGCALMLFPHFYGSLEEQRLLLGVASAANLGNNLRILNPFFNAEAQMALYRKAVFAVSHRYHPTIFAVRAKCPFMCIRHQFKVDGLMKQLGDPGLVVTSSDSVEKWIVAFDQAWDERVAIGRAIDAHLGEMVRSSKRHLEILNTHLLRATL